MIWSLLAVALRGLAAACKAWESGLRDILILERDKELGGILNQCIHNGFGLHRFGEQLTGPEYAGRFIEMLKDTGVKVQLDTMVLEVTPDKKVHCVSKEHGYQIIEAKSIVLGMGCRERTRGAIGIPGSRPAGVYTAGAAQRYVNMEGYLVGKRVLILGSGDIGLIMARRMTLEGAKVLACVEVMPYSGGLTRNIVQCLNDFDIPLYLSHTIVDIQGKDRVEKAIVAEIGPDRKPIPGTEMEFDVDTILLSVGLIPENELTRQAGIPMDPHTKGEPWSTRTWRPAFPACLPAATWCMCMIGGLCFRRERAGRRSRCQLYPERPCGRGACADREARRRPWLHPAAAHPSGRRGKEHQRVLPRPPHLRQEHHPCQER